MVPQVTLLVSSSLPSTRSAVCVLVVSRVWPTEGPALLLLAAFFDPQTQLQHPIPTAFAHTYRAFSPLNPPVPSFSLLAAPPPSLPLTRTRQTCSRRAATRSVPVRCLLHLALSTPTPCCPKHFETANRSLVHLAVIVQLSGDRYPSPAGPWRQACLNGVVLSRLRRLCAAYVYPANIYCQSPSRPSPRCCEPLHCLECE